MGLLRLIEAYERQQEECIAQLERRVKELEEENRRMILEALQQAQENSALLLRASLAGVIVGSKDPEVIREASNLAQLELSGGCRGGESEDVEKG